MQHIIWTMQTNIRYNLSIPYWDQLLYDLGKSHKLIHFN